VTAAYAGLVGAITRDSESEGEKVVDVALSATGAVVDTVGAVDPFAAIAGAGVGWLLTHVDLLREPLDALLGDPDEINGNVDALRRAAAEMRRLAREHQEDLKTVAEWQGQAGDAYNTSLGQMAEELESLGTALDGTAAVVGISGMLVTTLRGIVFGVISSLITELIRDALIAAASAGGTLGGSVAAFGGVASTRAAATAADISGRISDLVGGLGRQTGRLGTLAEEMSKITDGLDRFTMAAT
jgi:uncharacterized protein YukE